MSSNIIEIYLQRDSYQIHHLFEAEMEVTLRINYLDIIILVHNQACYFWLGFLPKKFNTNIFNTFKIYYWSKVKIANMV